MTDKMPSISHFDGKLLAKFRKISLGIGGLLLALGIVGVLVPQVLSAIAGAFLGWLLLGAGVLNLYLAFLARWRSVVAWLKPVLLILSGGLVLLNPLAGVVAISLMIALYLFMDGFGSMVLAQGVYPASGWGWMAANGVVSLALALLMTFAWPANSLVLVGLYLGISLMFDGIALILLGLASKNIVEEVTSFDDVEDFESETF